MVGTTRHASKSENWSTKPDEHHRSGQSVWEFCNAQGLSVATYYYWHKKLRDIKRENLPSRFVPLPSKIHAMTGAPRITLPNGVQIDLGDGLDAATVREFLQNLCGVGNARP